MAKLEGKVLIANRGEIARKIIRVCKRLGLESIAIFTPIEENYPHVLEADYAVCLGEGPNTETYLNIEKILKIAKDFGATFIHPGYGFLSENKNFSNKVKEAGIKFVGPDALAIDLMGDKRRSKELVEQIQGPLIPGYHGKNQDGEFLKVEAQKIGYPVLIKASAGGGGKGMRLVEDEKDFIDSLASAKSEAMAAFKNDEVLLEKYIVRPRHIEVQVFSDSHGNHVHLFDRECSIQRRHQKVIEEAPAPRLSEETKIQMRDFAVNLARKIDYLGAGTVEFVVDADENYYFLEMNTRLQVEHPVTEYITGTDLISWQLMVAAGLSIPKSQDQIISRGHAVEARLYSEDPDQGFIPQSGKLLYIGEPTDSLSYLDSAHKTGDIVGMDFDPMLAKLMSYGEDRESAIAKLALAIEEVGPLGFKTNFEYVKRILSHKAFLNANVDTSFVEKYKEDLMPTPLSEEEKALCIAANLLGPKVLGASLSNSGKNIDQKIPVSFRNC